VRVVRGRVSVRRLLPALVLGWLAAGAVTTQANAIIVTTVPKSGLATTYMTTRATAADSCANVPPGVSYGFNFYWDNSKSAFWTPSVPCDRKLGGFDTGVSPRFLPPTGQSSVGSHTIRVDVQMPTGGLYGTGATTYIIDPPPPPPTHAASPPPTHAPSPTPTPTPIPTPSPRCTTEGPAHSCVPVNCAHLTSWLFPGDSGGGVPPLMLALMALPFGAVAMFTAGFKKPRIARASALLLLLVTTSCAPLFSKSAPTSPTPVASVHTVVGFETTPDCRGYWMASSNGGIYPFGSAAGLGSSGAIRLNKPIVGMESTPDGGGYWLVASDGGVFPFGDAGGFGSTGSVRLNKPIVAMEDTPDGGGYWLVASDGGIFPFGDATGYGSTGSVRLNQPIVDMEATPDGRGYWLVAGDGGIFPFGDAGGFGSTGSVRLNKPIVGMEATPDGGGYWLVASDGGVFPFGDAIGYGSTGSIRLNKPIVGMEETPDGHGYWLIASDGGVFPFGDAPGYGSLGGVSI
jgi:hypothetical protein